MTGWRAYPTECRTPIDAAEARRIAEEYLYSPQDAERGCTVDVIEYDTCFTIVIRMPPPPLGEDGIPLMPVEPGEGVEVIDKETGHVSTWPSWHESTVAQKYAEAKEAGEIEYFSQWPYAR